MAQVSRVKKNEEIKKQELSYGYQNQILVTKKEKKLGSGQH